MVRSFSRVAGPWLLVLAASALANPHDHGGHAGQSSAAQPEEREVLYWYDPMFPQQRFEAPGRSPFMDMDLVPRYAESGDTITIEPEVARRLGVRLATVERANMEPTIHVSGVIGYDQRQLTILQARANAWVVRVPPRAPDELIEKGEVLAELLVPEWVAAQEEYLALRRFGDDQLLAAGSQRMRLVGMPESLMQKVKRSGQVHNTWVVESPVRGAIRELGVREGMTLAPGSGIAQIVGVDPVWLDASVPEAQAGELAEGQPLQVHLAAMPGITLDARVSQVLPEADPATRVVRLRAELANADGRLRPGMTARVTIARTANEESLLLPADAVIRSGRRDVVLVWEEAGQYRPVEVLLGQESGDRVEVLAGLEQGQRVVASAQFLLDSEANLRGLLARALDESDSEALHSATAVLIYQDEDGLMLEHERFETLGMDGMTMQFEVADGVDTSHLQDGDHLRVWVRQDADGLPVVRVEKLEDQP
ncbi:efflux RND transporter periplasmic adaptor subunit [Pseudomonas sp.]|uniref:efflux RND transporter periplasmic adaptor subunit n=1 Tax=Pseudomonas sp. TaxID=306 RepID=UPI00272B15B2|nr:efflux RND transporter periplasmic adaptor subunit [Pseudomonas sp.]